MRQISFSLSIYLYVEYTYIKCKFRIQNTLKQCVLFGYCFDKQSDLNDLCERYDRQNEARENFQTAENLFQLKEFDSAGRF